MKTNTLFQVRFRPSVKPPRGFTKSAHYNVTAQTDPFIGKNEYLIGNTWLPAKDFIKIEIEDAPVFNKPPLRKIASMKPDEVIECNDIPQLEAVCAQAIKENIEDAKDVLSSIKQAYTVPIGITCNRINKNTLHFGSIVFYKVQGCTILPASKFVEVAAEGKDEQVEKPEQFKVGDWVRSLGGCEFEQGMYIETDAYGMAIIENADWYKIVVPHHTLRKIDRPIESYKPFPKGYVIPKDTRVVALTDGDYKSNICEKGCKGTVVCERELSGGYVNFDGKAQIQGGSSMLPHELAPLDDRDHPEHPEFGKKKQKETITQAQKDECRKLQERIKELERQLHQQEVADVLVSNDISAYKDEIRQLTKRYERIVSVCNDAQYNANADLMYITLRSIANGEI